MSEAVYTNQGIDKLISICLVFYMFRIIVFEFIIFHEFMMGTFSFSNVPKVDVS